MFWLQMPYHVRCTTTWTNLPWSTNPTIVELKIAYHLFVLKWVFYFKPLVIVQILLLDDSGVGSTIWRKRHMESIWLCSFIIGESLVEHDTLEISIYLLKRYFPILNLCSDEMSWLWDILRRYFKAILHRNPIVTRKGCHLHSIVI